MKFMRSRLFRKGAPGQSIVILALGMIGLLAVVGITTDISLLFVRYAQLRRAVDAASIAAAGQLREDRSFASVSLTARQFIEFHGINPREVFVETCEAAFAPDDDPLTPGLEEPQDYDPEVCTGDQRKLVRVTAQIESPTVFLKLLGFGNIQLEASAISETAVLDVVLIFDVSESMLAETSYADWAEVGMGMAFEPPILDIGDASVLGKGWWNTASPVDSVLYRMSNKSTTTPGFIPTIDVGTKTYIDYSSGVAPNINGKQPQYWWQDWFWQELHLGYTQQQVNDRLYYPNLGEVPSTNVPGAAAATAVDSPYYAVRSFIPYDVAQAITDGDVPNITQRAPRDECRVRFFPYSKTLTVDPYMVSVYNTAPFDSTYFNSVSDKWGGFYPTYNFYGCCNDPGTQGSGEKIDRLGDINEGLINFSSPNYNAPDGNFSDLVCQPFKQARDATRLFLERIDFLRGDRVGFVTFDRSAYLIDQDGNADGRNNTHMVETLPDALYVLNTHIGIRAEPNYYRWNEDGGGWYWDDTPDAITNPTTQYAAGIDLATGASTPIDYRTVTPGERIGNNYPVKDNCEFQNASMGYPFSRFATRNVAGIPDQTAALRNITTPDVYNNGFWASYPRNATITGATWDEKKNSYELWAQCRNANMGAALREANNALTDPTTSRREGTVWIMILLSDGAAGASDPVRINGTLPKASQPYQQINPLPYVWNDTTGPGGTNGTSQLYGTRGEYGYFGVCPPGGFDPWTGQNRLGELMLTEETNPISEPKFPFCSDEEPRTRHFCTPSVAARLGGDSSVGGNGHDGANPTGPFSAGFGPGSRDRGYVYYLGQPGDPGTVTADQLFEWNLANGHIYDLDIGNYSQEPNCDLLYDVDDYAHDWADFIGGVNEDSGDDAVLPTIFTIGFGITFVQGDGSCQDNVDSCLGEELLRYVADVGDNFQIDTDYQQSLRDDGFLDDSLPVDEYGNPDPCEPEDGPGPEGGGYDYVNDPGNSAAIELRQPGTSCGNYYNAPGLAELQQVFDDIASRMFTRLSR